LILESIDDIFKKTQLMQNLITEDLTFIKEKRLRLFQQLLTKEIKLCFSILSNLKSDLSTRLAEQQNLLESAKSEIEKNI
jgi:chromosome condensin MukBEF complex kleisin-like MukF subunit